MHDARMYRILLPKSLGGDELDLVTHAKVLEIIASCDASTAWTLGQGTGCSMSSAYMEPEAARRLFGPRDAVLAWGAGIQGKAVKVDGGYRVTGTWTFASGSGHATLIGGHSFIYEADGTTPVMRPDGSRADKTMLIPRAKVNFHDVWNVIGLRGTASDTFDVTDLFVPADEAVERDVYENCSEPGPLYRCGTSLAYAVGFAALQTGIARAMLDALKELALTKTPRGAVSSLLDSAVFHTHLARLEARYRGARAYLHAAAGEVDRLAASTTEWLPFEARVDCRLATVHVMQEALEVIIEAYKSAGANAIFPSAPFERRLRDAMTASQQVQARVNNFTTAGRCLLGLEPDSTMFF
jgi:alkylation response protein AidB-like acyl-CoA dehydrogenase